MPAGVRRERRGYEKIECVDIDKRCCFFLSDFSCRFHDTEPGSIHKNPGRFPCIISLRIRWHVRRHDTGRQKVNFVELERYVVSMQRKSA